MLGIYSKGKNCFTRLSTRIYCNKRSAASDQFHMFIQSIKIYTFYCRIIMNTDV